jgi:hypothetical protein
VIVHRRHDTALHEGAHVAALVLVRGKLPLRVSADRPAVDLAGVTEINFADDGLDETPADFLVVLLAPLLAESAPAPSWPIQVGNGHTRGDEHALAVLADHIGLTEADWLGIVERARRLITTHDFQRIARLVARALELKDELDADDLQQLIPRRLQLKYLEEVPELCNT